MRSIGRAGSSVAATITQNVFEVPRVLTYLEVKVVDVGDDIFEGKNAADGGESTCFASAT